MTKTILIISRNRKQRLGIRHFVITIEQANIPFVLESGLVENGERTVYLNCLDKSLQNY